MSAVHVSLELARHARENPRGIAVIGADGSTLTFAALEARVQASAHALHALGLARGERTAQVVPPRAAEKR